MSLIGFDADQNVGSYAPKAIANGCRLFFRYLKNLTAAEVTEIFAAARAADAAVGIITIFETSAQRALQGADAGAADAGAALRLAASVGQPPNTVIVGTADFDEQSSQDAQCKAYFTAFAAGIKPYLCMVYGNGALISELKSASVAQYTWDAGGSAMRGTAAYLSSGVEDVMQDVGDTRGLGLGISIDSDFAPHAAHPSDIGAWCNDSAAAVMTLPSLTELQQGLVASGADIVVDGIWGEHTAAALAEYYSR